MWAALRIEAPTAGEVDPTETFHFGRDASSDLLIGQGDRTISRSAGSFSCSEVGWVIRNESALRPLYAVAASGLRVTIGPGDQHLLPVGTCSVLVVGAVTHEIRVVVDATDSDRRSGGDETAADDPTIMPTLTEREREAIAAVAARFFRPPPRHEPRPLTYAEAGALLGLPASTVRKRVERVRAKLADVGVAGMEADDARGEVCDFLLATGLITAADLVDRAVDALL